MNEETVKKWIAKAENDLKIGKDEMEKNFISPLSMKQEKQSRLLRK